jgi:hypothetical protein
MKHPIRQILFFLLIPNPFPAYAKASAGKYTVAFLSAGRQVAHFTNLSLPKVSRCCVSNLQQHNNLF